MTFLWISRWGIQYLFIADGMATSYRSWKGLIPQSEKGAVWLSLST